MTILEMVLSLVMVCVCSYGAMNNFLEYQTSGEKKKIYYVAFWVILLVAYLITDII